MAQIRVFIAVLLSDGLRSTIKSVQDDFKNEAYDFKWVAKDNLHVTLKFLGNVGEHCLDSIHASVSRAVVGFEPFELTVLGAGAFPNPCRPRVLWVGIDDGAKELSELAGLIDLELKADGFPPEEKDFRPHITIGRARNNARSPDLSGIIEKRESGPLGTEKVGRVVIMRSDLQRSGPIYLELREVVLEKTVRG